MCAIPVLPPSCEEVIVSLICLTAWTTVKDDLSLTEREEGR